MQKKIFSLLLAAMMVCLLAFAVMADDFIEIGDADGLMALMNAEDEATLNCNYKMTADIDLTDIKGQTPIGTREVPFTGIFDGNGFTVKGLDITSFLTETGLFGGTKGATIQNLTVEGSVVSTGNNVSGIVGRAVLPVTIINCVNKASVLMMDGSSKVGCGGIVGSLVSEADDVAAYIENCVNYGDIVSLSGGSGYCAGINGYILSQKHAEVDLIVKNCVNYGSIECVSASVGGGICGYVRFEGEGTSGEFTLTDCANFGKINARSYNGGIVGAIGGDNGVTGMIFTVNNVYNAGSVSGMSDATSNSGSIIGLIRHPATVDADPINVSNAMDVANANLSVIGSLGALTDSSLTLNGLYTTAGESIISYNPGATGVVYATETLVTLANCAVATSAENELAALVASDSSAWSMVDGAPALTYFADLIAEAPAVLESLKPVETEAPETTAVPETTAAPDVDVEPEETEDAGVKDDEEKPEESKATTKAPTTPAAPAEDGAPIGLIIGIVAAVIVVAVVVVIILKKKKK